MVRVLSILLCVVSFSAYARSNGSYFRNLRHDMTIPEACRELSVEDFTKNKLEYFTYSISGAQDRGFTYEYPLHRGDATQLWNAMKKYIATGSDSTFEDPKTIAQFEILKAEQEPMDFSFNSEGDVLELLAIVEMQSRLPEGYFVTGGLFYSDREAGELDLIVGKSTDCSVEMVGEAKLNVRKLGLAKSQLARFRAFLNRHDQNTAFQWFELPVGF